MPASLGPYELRSELGRGAMAVVWRAYDPALDREVALKEPRLPHGLDSASAAEFAARFVREAKAAAKLNHPNIVTVYAADIYDGHPVIVMELIEGETLRDILARGPLAPAVAASVLDQLLLAAGYAHSRGIVHRDIKPDNVFLTPDGRVKLADFGIASVGNAGTLTQAGSVLGTPGYMAPEQVVGAPVDSRADIFAIGVLGYEMLTGRNPFGATEGLPTTSIMYKIVHEAPSEISPVVLAGLPVDLRPVLAAALAKNPAERFGTAEAFRTALQGGPVQVAGLAPSAFATLPPTGAYPYPSPGFVPAPQRPRRPRWLPYALVGGIAAVVLVVLLIWANLGSPAMSVPTTTVAGSPQTSVGATTTSTSASTTTTPTTQSQPGPLPQPGPPEITVPSLMGKTRANAMELLVSLGLQAQVESMTSDQPVGKVILQNPEPNIVVSAASAVTLWISAGPQSQPVTTTASPPSTAQTETEWRCTPFGGIITLPAGWRTKPSEHVKNWVPELVTHYEANGPGGMRILVETDDSPGNDPWTMAQAKQKRFMKLAGYSEIFLGPQSFGVYPGARYEYIYTDNAKTQQHAVGYHFAVGSHLGQVACVAVFPQSAASTDLPIVLNILSSFEVP